MASKTHHSYGANEEGIVTTYIPSITLTHLHRSYNLFISLFIHFRSTTTLTLEEAWTSCTQIGDMQTNLLYNIPNNLEIKLIQF